MQSVGRVLAVLGVLATAGCIESATVLSVSKDGSGKILVREYYSPQLTQMMAMGETAADGQPPTGIGLFQENIEEKAEAFGPNVRLVRSEARQNKKGWSGFQATYAFDDVNDIVISIGGDQEDGEQGMSAGGAGDGGLESGNAAGEAEEKDDKDRFHFEFEGGEVCTLRIIPEKKPVPAPPPKTEGAPPATPEEDEMASLLDSMGTTEAGDASSPGAGAGNEMAAAMMEGMGGMMGGMLQGMRMMFVVTVDGKIMLTNSSFPAGEKKNAITVMDVPVDKMMNNPRAMQILTSQEMENKTAALEQLDIAGVKLEEPNKVIEVKFR